MTKDLIAQTCTLIDRFLDGEPDTLPDVTLNALGAHFGVSPFALQKAFKKALGISPREYANAKRAERLRTQLKGDGDVSQAAYAAGYGSIRALYEQAEATLGMSPSTYKKGGAGVAITYAIAACHLDLLILGATPYGVCFLAFGSDPDALVLDLKQEFPKAASFTEDTELLECSLKEVIRYLEGKRPDPDIPLDISATAFQRRVWRELWAIPPGETRTYSQIAELLGMDTGQRAVARACASNNVSLIIPCHRVIREDGGLGGYRWGINRKKLLLALEDKLWNDETFALTMDER